MSILLGISRLLIGAFFGALSSVALVPAAAALIDSSNGAHIGGFYMAVVAIGALLGVFAPTIRRAFGRSFLLLGASIFVLPISTMMLSGKVSGEMMRQVAEEERAMAIIGSGIAGMAMTGAAAFIGFFIGSVLLIIGLILSLGGRREVIVVQQIIDPQYGQQNRRMP